MEEQAEGRKAQERRKRPAGRAALILALFLAAGAVVLWAFLERAPSREAQAAALARRADFCEYVCDAPASSLPPSGPCTQDWVQVKLKMESSGCPRGDGECWTTWARTEPYAWYECLPRVELKKGVGDGTPPAGDFRPYTVRDPRAFCNDEDCVEKWAAGTWYVNALARPVFPEKPEREGGWCTYRCTWRIDTSHFYWFFGEEGHCYACNICSVPPTATPPPWPTPTATPQPTECAPGTPTPPAPTPTLPPPTPLPAPPTVYVSPLYYVRDPRWAEGEWSEARTIDRLYWLWQLQLYIRPWAVVSGVGGVEPGCRVDSTEVTGIWVEEVGPDTWTEGERRVCPPPRAPDREVYPRNTLYAQEGRSSFCGWREDSEDYAMRLLWSREPMQPKQAHPLRDASLNQYGITPWTQGEVLIRYWVRVHVTYTCGITDESPGFTYTAVVYGQPADNPSDDLLTLRVRLMKPVRQYIPPGR